MSQIKKHTWKGLAVAAAMLLSVGLMTQTVFAAVTVTTAPGVSVDIATTNAAAGNTFTAVGNVVFTSTAVSDFPIGGTIIITPPTGWVFDGVTGVTATTTTAATVTPTAVGATVVVTTTVAVGGPGTITVAGLKVKPSTAASEPGGAAVSGTAGVTGTALTVGGLTPFLKITSNAATVLSDGTTSATITGTLRSITGALVLNELIAISTSRGTLSATSSTTSATSFTTGATGSGTVTFRGNGTTGTANLTATTPAPNAAIATLNLTVVSPTITPTTLKFRDATDSAHIAASIDTVYVTTNNITQVRFQTTDGAGLGSANQLIQATVDKGNIREWVDADADGIIDPAEILACADNTSASFTSKTVIIDALNVDGLAVFFVCAKAGQAAGPIKVTAKNLSTTMTDATTTVTSAGVPNKIEAVVTGSTVQVTVKDKDGNNVAENTPVTFQVPAFTGTVAPACGLTSGGKAAGSAAFSGTGGQVLITVFHNSSGAAAGCPAGGSTVSASTVVTVGTGVTPPPAGTGSGFIGSAPAKGSIGLLVTAGATNATSLVSAFATAGCTVESLAILEGGVWKIYINGAPAVVNAAFPASLPATLAFFVRCAA